MHVFIIFVQQLIVSARRKMSRARSRSAIEIILVVDDAKRRPSFGTQRKYDDDRSLPKAACRSARRVEIYVTTCRASILVLLLRRYLL